MLCLYSRAAEKGNSRKPIFKSAHPYALGPGQSPLLVLLGLERFHKMLWRRIMKQASALKSRWREACEG